MEGAEPGAGAVELADADAEALARADEALDRFLPHADEVVAREHHVTAIVLSHQGAQWLPRTLAAVRAQQRAPDLVVGVDAGSTDGSAEMLGLELGSALEADPREGMAWALRAGALADALLAPDPIGGPQGPPLPGAADDGAAADQHPGAAGRAGQPGAGIIHWLWIVHDDSAPEPGCLAALLAGADRNPGAHVLVPKSVAWADPGRLVGIGSAWSPGMPVVDLIEPGERDQGQYDMDRPVYTGDSAGMLVRTDTWNALAGIEPELGPWAGPADLCRRTWDVGGQVMAIPAAVVAHRQAGHRGVRPGLVPVPAPRRAARHGQLMLELTQGSRGALPWRWLRGWASTVARALALLLTREPEEASAELAGAWDALAHPLRLRRARAAVRRPPVRALVRPVHLRAPRGAVLGHALDSWAAAAPRRRRIQRPHLPRSVWLPLTVAAVLAVLSLTRAPGILIGSGTLRGGGLMPAPSAGDLLATYLASWQEARFGVPSGQPSYLPLLAVASLPLLGSVDLLLRLVLGLAVPLAFLSAYASIGSPMVGRHRMTLALAWAVLPAGVAAVGAGRLSTVGLLLLAPPAARLVLEALRRARGGDRSLRPAIAAGTMLGAASAFAPYAGLLVVLGGLTAWLIARMPRWPVRAGLVIVACTATFVWLWGLRVVRAPWLLLSDLGRNDPTLVAPGPWLAGLSPGGPTSAGWAGVALVVLAVALVLGLAPRGAHLAGLAVAVALVVLVAWTPSLAALVWPGIGLGAIWPGQPLLLAAGILAVVAATLVAHRGATADPAPRGSLVAVADVVGRGVADLAWIAVVVVLAIGWWRAPSIVAVGSGTGLPPVVGLAEQTPERPRALVLATEADTVRYAVSSGSTAWLGTADALAAPESDPAFAEVVASLVAGAISDVEGELGGRGIRYVVFDGSQGDPLVEQLDAVIGLRRLASADDQTLWQVSGQPARAVLAAEQPTPEPDVVVPITTTPTSIDVVVHPQAVLPRTLYLAESADSDWRAESAGTDLSLREDARGMLTAQVTEPGPLQVEHRGVWPALAGGQLVAMLALVVLSLPKRRTPDLDGEVQP